MAIILKSPLLITSIRCAKHNMIEKLKERVSGSQAPQQTVFMCRTLYLCITSSKLSSIKGTTI